MRPAIYLKRGGKREVISLPPNMFGMLMVDGGPAVAVWGREAIPVEGTVAEFLAEQEMAMNSEKTEEAYYARLLNLMSDEAMSLLEKVRGEVKEGYLALVWPDGRYRVVVDRGDTDEDTVEIDGVDTVEEGVFAYSYKELQAYGNLAGELAQNIVDNL